MFVRIGSRHFAHLYTSGLLGLRLGFFDGLHEFPLEGRRHDGTVRAPREDVPASTALPDAARLPVDGYGLAARTGVLRSAAFLDLLDAPADPHPVARAEIGRASCRERV